MDKEFYTVREISQRFGVSEMTIRRMVMNKQIPSYRIGGSRLFKIDEIEDWIKKQKDTPKD